MYEHDRARLAKECEALILECFDADGNAKPSARVRFRAILDRIGDAEGTDLLFWFGFMAAGMSLVEAGIRGQETLDHAHTRLREADGAVEGLIGGLSDA